MSFVKNLAPRAGEPARRAARRLAERERTAPHAKLLARRGFMGQRPQLRVRTSELCGKMMRRLIDTECRQVYELQHTQTVHSEVIGTTVNKISIKNFI